MKFFSSNKKPVSATSNENHVGLKQHKSDWLHAFSNKIKEAKAKKSEHLISSNYCCMGFDNYAYGDNKRYGLLKVVE